VNGLARGVGHGDSQGLVPLKKYFATATFDHAASTTESRVLAACGRPLRVGRVAGLAQIAVDGHGLTRGRRPFAMPAEGADNPRHRR
jgi:hypothetical protein